MPEVGDTIDRFVIEAVLGEGGMGRVYRALDPKLGRRVALKVMLAEGASDTARSEAAARMMREARAAAAFNHPNVVAIYDVGEIDGRPYIAMELVAGSTLRAFVADKSVSDAQRIAWLVEVARGLGAAHRAGLVHRDIKPDNVMITTDGVVKILDFGIARASEAAVDAAAATALANMPSITAEGVSVGTPQYMAPEQIRGEPLDGRADQFAWGVMAYELLARRSPWSGATTPVQLFAAVLSATPPALSAVAPSIDRAVSDAVARALAKARDARFATMEEVVLALGGTQKTSVFPPKISAPEAFAATTEQAVASTRTAEVVDATKTIESSKRPAVWIAVAGALVVGAVGATVVASRSGGGPSAASSAPASASAPTPPRKGRPPATPAAVAAYEAALEALRNDQLDEQARNLEAALASDPSIGAAHLRLALYYAGVNEERSRAEYHKTVQHRSTLGEIDEALLDAYEPRYRDPPDRAERTRRLEALVKRYAGDAYLECVLGDAYVTSDRLDDAVAAYERALADDPHFAPAFDSLVFTAIRRGDVARARELADRCVAASPSAIGCLESRSILASNEGRCDDVKADRRRVIGIDPTTGANYTVLANAMYALGESSDTIAEVIRRQAAREPDADRRKLIELDWAAKTAALDGDFPKAEKILGDEVALVASTPKLPQFDASKALIATALEAGDLPRARAELKTLRARLAVEVQDENLLPHWAVLVHWELEAGVLTHDAFHAEQQRIVSALKDGETRRAGKREPFDEWQIVYGAGVADEREAAEALALLPAIGSAAEAMLRAPEIALVLGKVYALSGRGADAKPLLVRATRGCMPLTDVVASTRAYFWLGLALEKTGDAAGARMAYAKVLARWGRAKPRSITAEKARARLAALAR